MKISHVSIKNILGIKSASFEAGKVNIISGPNGVGKTSILDAIKGAVSGGHEARLLHNGSEEGEVVFVLDDGRLLRKSVGENKSKAALVDGTKEVKRSATIIKDMIDPFGLSPVEFLTANKKDRVKLLLESLPLDCPVDAIESATGLELSESEKSGHPLIVIEQKRADIYGDRTQVNSEIKQKKAVVQDMKAAIPFGDDGKDWGEEEERLMFERDDVYSNMTMQIEGLKCKAEKDVEAIRAEQEAELNEIRAKYQGMIDSTRAACLSEVETLKEKAAPELDEYTIKITEAKQNAGAYARIQQTKEAAEKYSKELLELEQESEGYTKAIDQLDRIKLNLVKTLPIEGLEVKKGDIYLKGVQFDSVNESARIRFALSVVALRDSGLKICCVDGIEVFDEQTLKIFEEEAKQTDLQFFVTRVTNDPELLINGKAVA